MDTESAIVLSGIKAVVVDDNRVMCRVMAAILEGVGCDVVTASDGFSALGKIVDHTPDVIVLDTSLPRLDGYQVCAVIKQNPKFRQCPVVLVSVSGSLMDRAQAQAVGADRVLVKPLVREELLAVVGQLTAPVHLEETLAIRHGG
ncbi:MAG: twitching motility two-component system response regulator PilG [Gammaproteobacteria bacterium]|nr:MAG: twitching motility two-component system response regulator PilG [Gammaproteobacteria bacterium]TND05316.1 MAG: twitching motility two-component system response regulator PilG [Gammaproteobacteria bacterium]